MESDALPAVGNDDDSHPLHVYDNPRTALQNNRIPSAYGIPLSEGVQHMTRNMV